MREDKDCSLELLFHESATVLAQATGQHLASLIEAVVLLHAVGILDAQQVYLAASRLRHQVLVRNEAHRRNMIACSQLCWHLLHLLVHIHDLLLLDLLGWGGDGAAGGGRLLDAEKVVWVLFRFHIHCSLVHSV